jgi:hypothetical protein
MSIDIHVLLMSGHVHVSCKGLHCCVLLHNDAFAWAEATRT